MSSIRSSSGSSMLLVCLLGSIVVAQTPKPPTPLPADIQSVDQLPLANIVVLWIDGQNLTVYVDWEHLPDDQNTLSTLEIKWEGPGPGFVKENCDFANIFTGDFDVCRSDKIAKVKVRGFGPVYDLGNIVPEGYLSNWNPAEAWIVDGSEGLDDYDPNSPYFGPVPEPSSLTLLCIGLLLLRRRPKWWRKDR